MKELNVCTSQESKIGRLCNQILTHSHPYTCCDNFKLNCNFLGMKQCCHISAIRRINLKYFNLLKLTS